MIGVLLCAPILFPPLGVRARSDLMPGMKVLALMLLVAGADAQVPPLSPFACAQQP